jgi:hypothetical protein
MAIMSLEQIDQRLIGADSIAAVIAIVRDYVAQWSPSELARLPENCRPDTVTSAEDVQWWADSFGFEYDSGEMASPELREMHDVFLSAARRIRQIGP